MKKINIKDNPRYKKLEDLEKETKLKDMPLDCVHITDMWEKDGQWPDARLPSAFAYYVLNLDFDNEFVGIHYYFSVSGILSDFEDWYNEKDNEECEKFIRAYQTIKHQDPPDIEESDIEIMFTWAESLTHKVCLMAEDH